MDHHTVEMFIVVRRISISGLFWKKAKVQSKGLSWYGVVSVPLAKVTYTIGTINAEKYIEILEQHMLLSRRHPFQAKPMHIPTRQCKTTFCTHFKGMAEEEECAGAGLAYLQSSLVPNRECVAHFETQNATTKTLYRCTP